jgi:hypothetical protein
VKHRPGLVHVFLFALVIAGQGCASPAALAPTPSPTVTPTPRPRIAEVAELVNEVDARTTASDAWRSATVGVQVVVGGGVKTGDEARARVDLSDGGIVRLAANTEFELAALSPEPTESQTRFALAIGKVWAQVTQVLGSGSFEIETLSGTATVRGSLMSVEFFPEDGHMIVSCLEGECRLTGASGTFTDLAAGEQAEIPGFGQDPTPPQPIDTAQLDDWAQEVPEAQPVVSTITPGPPPTETPTPTPTQTTTPTITPTSSPPIAVVGHWTGTTDQGWAVSFDVTTDGVVEGFLLERQCSARSSASRLLNFGIPIINDRMLWPPSPEVSTTFNLSAEFTSPTTVRGTFTDSAQPVPGATCTTAGTGAWEAQGP